MLTIDDYLCMVEARLESDKKLAVYLNQAGDKTSAVRVMRRVRTMQEEISATREALANAEN